MSDWATSFTPSRAFPHPPARGRTGFSAHESICMPPTPRGRTRRSARPALAIVSHPPARGRPDSALKGAASTGPTPFRGRCTRARETTGSCRQLAPSPARASACGAPAARSSYRGPGCLAGPPRAARPSASPFGEPPLPTCPSPHLHPSLRGEARASLLNRFTNSRREHTASGMLAAHTRSWGGVPARHHSRSAAARSPRAYSRRSSSPVSSNRLAAMAISPASSAR